MTKFLVYDTGDRPRLIAEAADKLDVDLFYLRKGTHWFGRVEKIADLDAAHRQLVEVAKEQGFSDEGARAFAGVRPYGDLPRVTIPHQAANDRLFPKGIREVTTPAPTRIEATRPTGSAVPLTGPIVPLKETTPSPAGNDPEQALAEVFAELGGYSADVATRMARGW